MIIISLLTMGGFCSGAKLKIDTICINSFYYRGNYLNNYMTGFNRKGDFITLESSAIPPVRVFPDGVDKIEIGRSYEVLIDSLPSFTGFLNIPMCFAFDPTDKNSRNVYRIYNIINETVYSIYDNVITTALYSYWQEFHNYPKTSKKNCYFVSWFTNLPKIDNIPKDIYQLAPSIVPVKPLPTMKVCNAKWLAYIGLLRKKELEIDDILICSKIKEEISTFKSFSNKNLNFIRNYKKIMLCVGEIDCDTSLLIFDNDVLMNWLHFFQPIDGFNIAKKISINYITVDKTDSLEVITYGDLINNYFSNTKLNNNREYPIYLIKHIEVMYDDYLPTVNANATIEIDKPEVEFLERNEHATIMSINNKSKFWVDINKCTIKNRDILPKIIELTFE